jgi:iron complex transport system substrate-binding protein
MWLPALIASALLLTGCQDPPKLIGGKLRSKHYTSAVSLSPGVTEVLRTRAYMTKLMGVTDRCDWPAVDLGAPVVVREMKPNYEGIAQIEPAIVVYDIDLYSEQEMAKFKELGLETFAFEGNTLEEYITCLRRFASKVGAETQVDEMIGLMEGAASFAAGNPIDPKPKVAILMAGQGSEHMISGTKSFQADLVRKSGAEVVGPEASLFVALNAESLVAMNPDAILVAGNAKGAESIVKDPRLASIAAVKNGRVVAVAPGMILRRGARVETLIKQVHGYLSQTFGQAAR